MIEILKRGTKQVATCRECGCKFSFEDEDIKRRTAKIAMDCSKGFSASTPTLYVHCPQCDTEILVHWAHETNIKGDPSNDLS